jgi:hypothetical protein
MVQNRLYDLFSISGSESRLRGSVGQSQLTGLACVLIGASQLPLAFVVGEQPLVFFVMGSGGWLLISIGVNLFRRRDALEGWGNDEQTSWLSAVGTLLFSLFVVVATGVVLVGLS